MYNLLEVKNVSSYNEYPDASQICFETGNLFHNLDTCKSINDTNGWVNTFCTKHITKTTLLLDIKILELHTLKVDLARPSNLH